ncbi:MAG: DUF3820 family protein [Chitinivibrionales bacterium]
MADETREVPDPHYLIKLARTQMPFGKYKGRYLLHLPEEYLVWFQRKGFPAGRLGDMLRDMLEIKINGLEHLIAPLVSK